MRCLFFVCSFFSLSSFSQDTLESTRAQYHSYYVLFDNGSFEYRWWACISGGYGQGHYELSNKKAIFHFEEIDTISHIIEENLIEGDSITVKVLSGKDSSSYVTKMQTSDKQFRVNWMTKEMTVARCDSAQLKIMGYPDLSLDFTKTESNEFTIYLYWPSLYQKIAPKREVFKIKNETEFTQINISKWKDENGKKKRKKYKDIYKLR